MLLKQKKSLPLLEVESQFLDHPAHSLTTTVTVLSQSTNIKTQLPISSVAARNNYVTEP